MTDHTHDDHNETAYCEKHPDREATLRCNRCNRRMCSKCAVHTPTGYRCEDCVRGQQKVFDTAQTQDFIFGPLAAGFVSFIGGLILPRFGIFLLLLGGAFVGGLVAETARRVISRRRSKPLFRLITATVFIAALLPALFPPLAFMFSMLMVGAGIVTAITQTFAIIGFSIVWNLVYAILVSTGTYYSLAGLRI